MNRRFAAVLLSTLSLSTALALAQNTAENDFQDNVVIVLDASGSMKTTMSGTKRSRMAVAKDALVKVTENIPPNTNVGLLVFSSSNLRSDWAYPLGKVQLSQLQQAIRSPEPGGGTPLGAYLKKGTDALLQQRKKQHGFGSYRLLVVSDGQASDQGLVETYLPDVMSRGVTVDCIGVDMAEDLSLATKVHSYRRADNPEQLVKAVQAIFAEVGGGPKTASQSDDDFAIIAGIPDQMAAAMLKALTHVGDHPIGEQPPAPHEPMASVPQYDPSKPGLPPTHAPGPSTGSWVGTVCSVLGCFLVVGLFVVGLLIIGVRKAAKNQTNRRRR